MEKVWVYNVNWATALSIPLTTALFALGDWYGEATTAAVLADISAILAPTMILIWLICAAFDRNDYASSNSWSKRREKAISSRPFRYFNGVVAIPDGDNVTVTKYTKVERSQPHIWPLSLGFAGKDSYYNRSKTFNAETEFEAAVEYKQELETKQSELGASDDAVALAKALNK